MTWGEALRLTRVVAADTSSMIHAALAGWQYPASREALVLMDLYDSFARINFKRPKPYPRPWDPKPTRVGNASLTPRELRRVLAAHRHAASPGEAPLRPARGHYALYPDNLRRHRG